MRVGRPGGPTQPDGAGRSGHPSRVARCGGQIVGFARAVGRGVPGQDLSQSFAASVCLCDPTRPDPTRTDPKTRSAHGALFFGADVDAMRAVRAVYAVYAVSLNYTPRTPCRSTESRFTVA